jgi:hypothetical protein
MQEEAMQNLEIYEDREEHWQDIFDSKRTRGEKAADSVAVNAGSWTFVSSVLSFIAFWVIANILIQSQGMFLIFLISYRSSAMGRISIYFIESLPFCHRSNARSIYNLTKKAQSS